MKPFVFLAIAITSLAPLVAQEPAPDAEAEAAYRAKMTKLAEGLKYEQGEITLKGGLAKIQVPEQFRYLGPEDAQIVLEKLWGNPPSDEPPLGMLFPSGSTATTPDSWAVVIQFEESGYVKDEDAHTIDYDDLLKKMRASVTEENKQRAEQGYPTVDLIGWAAPPRYDATAKKLYWAKELNFQGSAEHTLNYNIRMLGRRGVLELNAIASVAQLPEIEQAAPTILAMVDFQDGHRYADFDSKTDKVATYGIAALVAGGVLAKTGFLKVVIAAIIAGKKFVIIGLIALAALVKKLFFARKEPVE